MLKETIIELYHQHTGFFGGLWILQYYDIKILPDIGAMTRDGDDRWDDLYWTLGR